MSKLRTNDVDGVAAAMGSGREFETGGKLRGRPGSASGWDLGQLPEEWWGAVGEAAYVVFSHATPIAWRGADGAWVCPGVSYSVSTSRHQGTVRRAIETLAG